MWASESGYADTVRALLSAGAQADLQDEVSIVFVSYHRKIHPSRICSSRSKHTETICSTRYNSVRTVNDVDSKLLQTKGWSSQSQGIVIFLSALAGNRSCKQGSGEGDER